jgi:SH3 domain protein
MAVLSGIVTIFSHRVTKEHVPMNTKTILRILFGLIFILPLAANAAFITDKIMVEVRTERFGQGSVLKKLPSGTSVEVLMTDGKYTRIRTPNNITGWINSTFLTNKKPTQLEYLELLAKSKTTEAKLRVAEQQLANSGGASVTTTPASINDDEIEALKKEAQNARWMKVEMQKARDRAQQAEAKLKAELKKQAENGKQNNSAKQQLATLRAEKDDLEKRLAAAILVSEQQTGDGDVQITPIEQTPIPIIETIAPDNKWSVGMKWFSGSLFAALIIGFIAGITWLDKRSRQRHGGFRIY